MARKIGQMIRRGSSASAVFTLEVDSHVLPHMQDEAAMKVESLLVNE